MRVLLDTVTFVRAVLEPESLSKRATAIILNSEFIRELSSVSITEIAIKSNLGKLSLSREQVLQGISDLKVRVLSYTAQHALQLFGMPQHHTDPFDRQLLSQAIVEKIPIVTSDKAFHRYGGITVIS